MLYLLWAILNIGLVIVFLAICFNAAKLVKEKMGILATLVFVTGLLSFVAASNRDDGNKEPDSDRVKSWKFNTIDTMEKSATAYMRIDMEKTSISRYQLGISYSRNRETGEYIPLSGNSSTTGLQSGTKYRPNYIKVTHTGDKTKFEYEVYGTVEWSLLGIPIYSQPKTWKGVVLPQ